MPAKPKPTKATRPKRIKKVSSGERKKILAKQLEGIVKLIIFWRDGVECVQKASDGVRCGGNGLGWGHYIAQGQSAWLRYDLGNVFVQCANHNGLDYHGDKSYGTWFSGKFGQRAAEMMEMVRDAHRGQSTQRTVQEMEELLKHYDQLYQDRFYVEMDTTNLVKAGYYGEIIRFAWAKEYGHTEWYRAEYEKHCREQAEVKNG